MTVTGPTPGPVTATGKVITITDGQGQNPQGQWVRGRQVSYQLSSGHTGTVFIPMDQFNADTVRAAIAADAQRLADVANLTF